MADVDSSINQDLSSTYFAKCNISPCPTAMQGKEGLYTIGIYPDVQVTCLFHH